MAHGWEDVLTLQLRLAQALQAKRVVSALGLADEGWEAERLDSMFSDARTAAKGATPIYVSPDVMALWEEARHRFASEPLAPSDPFVPWGFALLPYPLALTEGCQPQQALLWAPVGDAPQGIALWGLCETGQMTATGAMMGGREVGWEEVRAAGFYDWHITALYFWHWGQTWDDPGARALQAFWRLGHQFVRSRQRLSRARRREAQRLARVTEEQAAVTVLRLRRTRPSREEPEGQHPVDWSCRWIVRGHWRDQWCPSEQRHRQTYVSPYIKGPEDQPLRITERVVEFVR